MRKRLRLILRDALLMFEQMHFKAF